MVANDGGDSRCPKLGGWVVAMTFSWSRYMEGDEGICRERDCVLHGGWPVDVDRWMLRGYAPIRLGAAGCGVSSGKRVDLSNFVVC